VGFHKKDKGGWGKVTTAGVVGKGGVLEETLKGSRTKETETQRGFTKKSKSNCREVQREQQKQR